MEWPKIDPGEMIHWVTILQQSITASKAGSSPIWTSLVSAYAKIEPVRGTEVIRSGQNTAQTFLIVSIYWQPGILPNMRVKANNGTYLIQSIQNPGERNVILKLLCIGLGANE